MPNVSNEPEGFFLKRSHFYPKILKNLANVFITDSAYKIEMKNGYDINSLIYCFYNSLTLSFAELEGRYYAGGVLELVPSEFKKLPIPYFKITEEEFEAFRIDFENKNDIEDILGQNDLRILTTVLKLSEKGWKQMLDLYQTFSNEKKDKIKGLHEGF